MRDGKPNEKKKLARRSSKSISKTRSVATRSNAVSDVGSESSPYHHCPKNSARGDSNIKHPVPQH
jgi:hypothetical protein